MASESSTGKAVMTRRMVAKVAANSGGAPADTFHGKAISVRRNGIVTTESAVLTKIRKRASAGNGRAKPSTFRSSAEVVEVVAIAAHRHTIQQRRGKGVFPTNRLIFRKVTRYGYRAGNNR